VSEFTLSMETPEQAISDEDAWVRIEAALRTSPDVSGAATVLHHETGVISSRFQVEAPTLEVAQMIGIRAFAKALRGAGLKGDSLGRVAETDVESGSGA